MISDHMITIKQFIEQLQTQYSFYQQQVISYMSTSGSVAKVYTSLLVSSIINLCFFTSGFISLLSFVYLGISGYLLVDTLVDLGINVFSLEGWQLLFNLCDQHLRFKIKDLVDRPFDHIYYIGMGVGSTYLPIKLLCCVPISSSVLFMPVGAMFKVVVEGVDIYTHSSGKKLTIDKGREFM